MYRLCKKSYVKIRRAALHSGHFGHFGHFGHSGHSGHSHRALRGERLLMGDDGCAVSGARSTPAAVWRASLLLSAAVGALLPAM